MGDEWRDTTLGNVVRLQRGHDLPDKERTLGPVPVMGSFGVTGWHDEARAHGPGVTIGRSGASVGVVSFIREDYWPLNTCLYVTDFQGNDPRFCYYWLSTLDLANYNSGSAQPSLNRNYIYGMPVRIPEVDEQRAIARILGTLDDKIELNRQMNETLEAMARAIFKSWFVDFDPVRLKAEGRDPGFPKATADLFPDRFENSELGEIPKGWGVDRFSNTVQIMGGGTPKTSVPEYWGGEIPWFSVVDAPRDADVWVVETEKKITQAGVNNSSAQVLPKGTTIISARGTVGRVALVGVPMAMNQSCYGLRERAGEQGFFTYFATRSLVGTLQQHTHGSVFDTITRDTLASVDVVVPHPGAVHAFEQSVSPVLERIRNNLFESWRLAALRDTLLPKLLSGKIRTHDIKQVTEVA